MKKRNTELRAMADLERVEVMLMRRPRWLVHVARMEETRISVCASQLDARIHAVGGQTKSCGMM